jgi:hypothetical protein
MANSAAAIGDRIAASPPSISCMVKGGGSGSTRTLTTRRGRRFRFQRSFTNIVPCPAQLL